MFYYYQTIPDMAFVSLKTIVRGPGDNSVYVICRIQSHTGNKFSFTLKNFSCNKYYSQS